MRFVSPAKTRAYLLILSALLLHAPELPAQQSYLAPGRPDGILLLAPPPVAGSPEEVADLACARAVFKGRTPDEEARAIKQSSLAFSLFAPAIGSEFDPTRLPRTDALLQQVKKEIGKVIDDAKNHWKRLRPYQMDPELTFGKPEASTSYPSGHSTRGTVYSLVLAEIFPADKTAILEIGRNIGWDRVLIGKHYPTDVYAGRVLGQAIVRELLANPSFRKDLELARAEVKNNSPVPAVQKAELVK
jgi:acid phosphatase (class A)